MKSKPDNYNRGEDAYNWKGDWVGETGLHRWVSRNKPKPKVCEQCNKQPPKDLANISGQYKRDVSDFEWLCRKCHMESDGRLERLHKIDKRGVNNPNYKHGKRCGVNG